MNLGRKKHLPKDTLEHMLRPAARQPYTCGCNCLCEIPLQGVVKHIGVSKPSVTGKYTGDNIAGRGMTS